MVFYYYYYCACIPNEHLTCVHWDCGTGTYLKKFTVVKYLPSSKYLLVVKYLPVEQDELSTYLKKFTDVWVAYALLLIAYVEVLSFPSPVPNTDSAWDWVYLLV